MKLRLQGEKGLKERFTISGCVNLFSFLTIAFAVGIGISNTIVLYDIYDLRHQAEYGQTHNNRKYGVIRELNHAIGYGQALQDMNFFDGGRGKADLLREYAAGLTTIVDGLHSMELDGPSAAALRDIVSELKAEEADETGGRDGKDEALPASVSSLAVFPRSELENQRILSELEALRDQVLADHLELEDRTLGAIARISNHLFSSLVGLITVLILLSGLSIWFIRSRILHPIKTIAGAMGSLADGKIFTPIPEVYPGDEISVLAKGVEGIRNEMVRRIHAEEKLRITQTHFEGIMSLATVAIITIDERFNIQIFNKGAERYFGYRAEEVRGKSLNILLPERYRSVHNKHIEGFLNAPETSRSMLNRREIYAIRKDGCEFPAEASISKIGYGGETTLTVILNDTTGRKRREEEIRKGRDMLRAMIDNFPGGISVIGKDLTFQAVNQKFFEIIGLNHEDYPVGSTYRSLVLALAKTGWYGPGDPEELADGRVRSLIKTDQAVFLRKTPDGRIIEVRSTPMPGGGVVRSHIDVTKEKLAEQELRKHRDHLADLVREKTAEIRKKAEELEEALRREKEFSELQQKFISLASHELRTPLTIIDSVSQRLIRKKSKLSEEGYLESRIEKIRQAVARMVTLIESTLMASRLEAGKIEGHFDRVNIKWLIKVICQRQRELGRTHEIKTDLENLPESIIGDETLLDHIFTNLLSNAVKYSPNGECVEVRGWRSGDKAVIRVTDRGLGIPEDEIPHLFKRFYRASTAEGIKGTGIGLVVVKDFVKLHDGSVEVESVLGEGTSFTVHLPIDGPKNWSDSQGRGDDSEDECEAKVSCL